LCLKCCSVHRNLGTHISKVRSCYWDIVDEDELERLKKFFGNINVNKIYEANLPPTFAKPNSLTVTWQERVDFIKFKYVEKKWFDKSGATFELPAETKEDENSSSIYISLDNEIIGVLDIAKNRKFENTKRFSYRRRNSTTSKISISFQKKRSTNYNKTRI